MLIFQYHDVALWWRQRHCMSWQNTSLHAFILFLGTVYNCKIFSVQVGSDLNSYMKIITCFTLEEKFTKNSRAISTVVLESIKFCVILRINVQGYMHFIYIKEVWCGLCFSFTTHSSMSHGKYTIPTIYQYSLFDM